MSQLLGKDTKEEKGVWKLLRGSDVCLTKEGPEGENQEVLGCGGERYSLANKCYKYLLALEKFHWLFPPWKHLVILTQFWSLCFMPKSANCPDFRAQVN